MKNVHEVRAIYDPRVLGLMSYFHRCVEWVKYEKPDILGEYAISGTAAVQAILAASLVCTENEVGDLNAVPILKTRISPMKDIDITVTNEDLLDAVEPYLRKIVMDKRQLGLFTCLYTLRNGSPKLCVHHPGKTGLDVFESRLVESSRTIHLRLGKGIEGSEEGDAPDIHSFRAAAIEFPMVLKLTSDGEHNLDYLEIIKRWADAELLEVDRVLLKELLKMRAPYKYADMLKYWDKL